MRCNRYGCEAEATEGKKQCEEHLLASRKYQADRREKLIREGKCTRCTGESRPGKTMCEKCAETWNKYLKDRRTK